MPVIVQKPATILQIVIRLEGEGLVNGGIIRKIIASGEGEGAWAS